MPETANRTQIFRFDEMAVLVKDRIDNPAEAAVDRYVGLEHLDSDSLKIRRWGEPTDVEATKLLFKAGDIIFGKRRVYQRKLALADFDGICSAHAMVLRAKSEVVLSEFLPFFMQSDMFMERAREISVGSLSPTINWKTLAREEFALPPLEEQRRIAEVLQAFQISLEAVYQAESCAKATFRAALEHLFGEGLHPGDPQEVDGIRYPSSWPIRPLSELASVERGKFSHRPRNLPEFFGGPYPFVQTGDVAASVGLLSTASQFLSEEGVQYSRFFPAGTVLVTIAAVIGETAITTTETWTPDSVAGVMPSESIDVRFLEYALRRLQPKLDGQLATKSTQKNINLGILRPLPIPCPNRDVQRDIARRLASIEETLIELGARSTSLKSLQSRLLGRCLCGESA